MHFFIIFFLLFLVTGCSKQFNYTSTYFDYSGSDGCIPANIGHRLGGDLTEYGDNTLEGMNGIEKKQGSKCFKNWEFDVNQTANNISLWHDKTHNGVPLIQIDSEKLDTPTLEDFVLAFDELKVIRPVVIDLKTELPLLDWPKLIKAARSIRKQHRVPVWFLVSPILGNENQKVCKLINKEFDILLYRRGGNLCE